MAFTRLFPRRGTVIPEHCRHGDNAVLHELPAYREHVHDLVGVLLYLPRTRWVVLPTRIVAGGGDMTLAVIVVAGGGEAYPPDGYQVCVSEWELQRAMRVVFDLRTVDTVPVGFGGHPGIAVAEVADGTMIKVEHGTPVVIEPEPGAFEEPSILEGMTARNRITLHMTDAGALNGTPWRPDKDGPLHCVRCGAVVGDSHSASYLLDNTSPGPKCPDTESCEWQARGQARLAEAPDSTCMRCLAPVATYNADGNAQRSLPLGMPFGSGVRCADKAGCDRRIPKGVTP